MYKKVILSFICIILFSTGIFSTEQITDNIYVSSSKYHFIVNLLNDIKFEQSIMTFSQRDREIVITEESEWIEEYKTIIDFCERNAEVFYQTKKIFFEKYIVPAVSENIIYFGNWVIYSGDLELEYNEEYKDTLRNIRYQLNYDAITLEGYVNIFNKFLNSNYKVERIISNNKISVQSRHEIPLLYLEEVFLKTLKLYGYNVNGQQIDINYGLSGIEVDKMVVIFFYSDRSNLENVIDIISTESLEFELIPEGKICLAIGSQNAISEITNKWRHIEQVFQKQIVKSYPTRIFKPDYILASINQVLALDKNTNGFKDLPPIDLKKDISAVPLFYSNSLLIGYPNGYENYFDNLVFHLGQMEEDQFNFVNVVDIIYGNADEIASILNDIYSDKKDIVRISTSNVSNSVIVRSVNRIMIIELTNIIKEFDRRPMQVLIEVLIAEVKLDDNFRYGFEWKIGDQNQQFGFEGLLRKGDVSGAVPYAGMKYSLLTKDKFDVFFNAMQTSSEVNILSKPQIMTKNNSPAKIVIGQEVPISKLESLNRRTDNINRSSSSSIDYDVDNPQTVWVNHNLGNYPNLSVEYKDVGITLEVTPTISKENSVMLDLKQIVSEIESLGLLENPIIRKREASTIVVAENNNTIVIGGMIKQNTTQVKRRVPGFSRIPLIGEALFTTNEKVEYSTELLIFITPTILDDTVAASSAE